MKVKVTMGVLLLCLVLSIEGGAQIEIRSDVTRWPPFGNAGHHLVLPYHGVAYEDSDMINSGIREVVRLYSDMGPSDGDNDNDIDWNWYSFTVEGDFNITWSVMTTYTRDATGQVELIQFEHDGTPKVEYDQPFHTHLGVDGAITGNQSYDCSNSCAFVLNTDAELVYTLLLEQ